MQRQLKTQCLGIVLVLILSTLAWSGESDLKLELESSVRTLRLGQKTTLRLRIAGAGVRRLTEHSEGIDSSNSKVSSFVYEFGFEPQREGPFTFGPYLLSFNTQPLTSNPLSIFVLPRWDGRYGTFFRIDSNSVTLGESIELVMETWSTQYEVRRCLLKREEAFTYTIGESTTSAVTSGKDTQVYSRLSWFITPKQPGEFKITRDLFESFPEGVTAPNLTVTVKEPAQPPVSGSNGKTP